MKEEEWTYQAKDPTSETNLSNSLLPRYEMTEQQSTVPALKRFFFHLTAVLCLPDLENRPFSMIRTAGNSCRGIERRMAMESAEYGSVRCFRMLMAESDMREEREVDHRLT